MPDIAILGNEGSWYVNDLVRAAHEQKLQAVRCDFTQLATSVGTGEKVHCGELDLRSVKSVIVRTMPPGTLEQVVFRMDALQRLETQGVSVVNSPRALECAVDKYLTTSRLAAVGLPVPETIVCETEEAAIDAWEQLGRDVLVKPLFGSEGRGIVRVSDPDVAHRTFRTISRLGAVLYLQRFIDHSGFDIRVLVPDGKVVGSIKRSNPHDYRSNLARQGRADVHDVTELEAEIALAATDVTGALIAGVDLLYDGSGRCYVIEVNAVPGWRGFSRCTGIDVASRLIQSICP
ncbi:MAG: RimK family alpha-L-glutamate ligase [Planctomycetaceae bacterium]|nr:RimK family alpha-L-glutamate ligase [Planctomycetaceae bacterium]